jgi:hypothetical protein
LLFPQAAESSSDSEGEAEEGEIVIGMIPAVAECKDTMEKEHHQREMSDHGPRLGLTTFAEILDSKEVEDSSEAR